MPWAVLRVLRGSGRGRVAMLPSRRVPGTGRQVVESNQVDVVAATMPGDAQQVVHAVEARLASQTVGNVGERDRLNRIDDDVAVVHRVTATHPDMRAHPDANAASDSPAPDSLAEVLAEHHMFLRDARVGQRARR